jgi:hypothetical protein
LGYDIGLLSFRGDYCIDPGLELCYVFSDEWEEDPKRIASSNPILDLDFCNLF